MSNFLLIVIAFLLACIADELTRIRKAIESRSNTSNERRQEPPERKP